MEKLTPFQQAMDACLHNGDRLLEDVRDLLDWNRPQSALALAVIAQEEFAKGFLLHLVDAGLVPWHSLILRASRDHKCKHLLGLVMDHLAPDVEKLMAQFRDHPDAFENLPGTVADALDLLRLEKIGRWESQHWIWVDPPTYDSTAKHVADGEHDRQKQDALYVRLSSAGGVASTPERVSMAQATAAFERANTSRAF